MSDAKKKSVSRMARTMRSLLVIGVLGGGLSVYSVYSNTHDVRLATSGKSEDQHQFFISASERPDMEVFFRSLKPAERVAMSQNIGRYDDPAMATLIGKCLGTFDAKARVALTGSLSQLAITQPAAVAKELERQGSFQQLAVAAALKRAGPQVLPLVADRLTNGDARPNAVAFLVDAGLSSVPALLPKLQDKDKDVRLAAADGLGKLRARRATAALVALYSRSTGDEKFGYLAALAGIGDPATEKILSDALNDERLPVAERAQSSIGLGRIASPTAIRLLWSYLDSEQPTLRQSAVSALQVAGDPALQASTKPLEQQLLVAGGMRTHPADEVLRVGLATERTRLLAAGLSRNRPTLVPFLSQALHAVNPLSEGDIADQIIEAMASTPEGLSVLKSVVTEDLRGLIDRRMQIQHVSE